MPSISFINLPNWIVIQSSHIHSLYSLVNSILTILNLQKDSSYNQKSAFKGLADKVAASIKEKEERLAAFTNENRENEAKLNKYKSENEDAQKQISARNFKLAEMEPQLAQK